MQTDFAVHLSKCLAHYLPDVKGASINTITSYRDAFRLFLEYCSTCEGMSPDKIQFSDIDEDLVKKFLSWLENIRGCAASTRNQRMAALDSFLRYSQIYSPECICEIQRILAIPAKKVSQPALCYIQFDDMKRILEMPDISVPKGRRDRLIMCLLYDTGARVSELLNIRFRDIRIDAPARVILNGKGSKQRGVPLMDDTVSCLKQYLQETEKTRDTSGTGYLFCSNRDEKFTRAGISYILKKYVDMARPKCNDLPAKVTPHTLRHSKAMHLLQAGVSIVYIKDILGHKDITTTQIYARADLNAQKEALSKAKIHIESPAMSLEWSSDTDLMNWLDNLCK